MDESEERDSAEESFETLLERSGGAPLKEVAVGDRVTGRIASVGDDDAFVDYGGRSEATIALGELRDSDGTFRYKVGDEFEAIVASVDDGVLLTLSGRLVQMNTEMLREAFENRVPVEGLVKAINKGGFEVEVSRVRGFCPISQIDSKYCETPSDFLGQKLSFQIIKWEDGGRNLVLSRRAVLEKQDEKRRQELRSGIAEGVEMEGAVTRVQPFGVFVDLGGVEGLVHVSELSAGRISHPGEHFSRGQNVRVKVLKVEALGQPNERISLSIKALMPDPWDGELDRFHQGSLVKGKVVSLTNFGVFVELAPGLDGLIHLSALSRRRVAHPREILSEGDEVEVEVLEIDPGRRRISLALKQSDEAADDVRQAVKAGDIVDCVVTGVKRFGIFADFTASDLRMSGLIPNSETGEPPGASLHKKFPKGRTLQAEIVNIDEQGRIRLSMTSLKSRVEREGFEAYQTEKNPRRAGTSLSMFADVLGKARRSAEEAQRKPDGHADR